MATYDVRLPLGSGRKIPKPLMSGFDPKQTMTLPFWGEGMSAGAEVRPRPEHVRCSDCPTAKSARQT
jgi:hypothetical protein